MTTTPTDALPAGLARTLETYGAARVPFLEAALLQQYVETLYNGLDRITTDASLRDRFLQDTAGKSERDDFRRIILPGLVHDEEDDGYRFNLTYDTNPRATRDGFHEFRNAGNALSALGIRYAKQVAQKFGWGDKRFRAIARVMNYDIRPARGRAKAERTTAFIKLVCHAQGGGLHVVGKHALPTNAPVDDGLDFEHLEMITGLELQAYHDACHAPRQRVEGRGWRRIVCIYVYLESDTVDEKLSALLAQEQKAVRNTKHIFDLTV